MSAEVSVHWSPGLLVKKLADYVAERNVSVLQGSFQCLHIWAEVRWVRPEDTSEGRKWTAQLPLYVAITAATVWNQTARIPVLWLIRPRAWLIKHYAMKAYGGMHV
jgi:hypothetical protein